MRRQHGGAGGGASTGDAEGGAGVAGNDPAQAGAGAGVAPPAEEADGVPPSGKRPGEEGGEGIVSTATKAARVD